MSGNKGARTYARPDCAVFRKTAEAFGGLSNMAPGFPVRVNGIRVLTIEALYQASRFPHLPDVQRLIIDQHSPMTAKMVSKPHRKDSREDWDNVRIKVMRWCLRLKLSQHWSKFSQLLLSTGDRAIVEDSRKDDFWGAVPSEGDTLVGLNVLGRLLMELREEIKAGAELRRVEPPAIPDFTLFGETLQLVDFRTDKNAVPDPGSSDGKLLRDEFTLRLFESESATTSAATTSSGASLDKRPAIIANLKPHAKYKRAGLPWLDSIPAHWEMVPNRALMGDQRKTVGRDAKDYILLSLTLRGVIARDMVNPKGKFPAQFDTYKIVRPDDFVFCLFDIDETPRGVGLSPLKGMITGAYDVLSPRDIDPRFLYHYYLFVDEGKLMKPLYTGLRKTIPRGVFASLKAPWPPPDEQDAIVKFLEHANRKIDRLVRVKRKMIGLLNEQKQALIHRIVTKGARTDVSLRQSGLPWLGAIPTHWELRKLKFEMSFCGGGTPSKANAAYWNGNIPWVSPKDMKFDIINDTQDHITQRAVAESSTNLVKAGSLLMVVRSGILQRMIPVALCAREVALNQDMKALTSRGNIIPDYFVLLVRACEKWLIVEWTKQGATVESIEHQFLANTKVPIPSLDEQREIIRYAEKESAPLTTAIIRSRREIELLIEYRTRLTADIVTGKLDVREAAAKLTAQPTAPGAEPVTDELVEEIEAEGVEA